MDSAGEYVIHKIRLNPAPYAATTEAAGRAARPLSPHRKRRVGRVAHEAARRSRSSGLNKALTARRADGEALGLNHGEHAAMPVAQHAVGAGAERTTSRRRS